ncbi:MAG: hypothetical protein RLZZ519_2588 [Bacteroidota bacterium]|jgi:hypothetical protein
MVNLDLHPIDAIFPEIQVLQGAIRQTRSLRQKSMQRLDARDEMVSAGTEFYHVRKIPQSLIFEKSFLHAFRSAWTEEFPLFR